MTSVMSVHPLPFVGVLALVEGCDGLHLRPGATHAPRLREFAVAAAWNSTIVAAEDLEDFLSDGPPEERVLPDLRTP
jgi:hypothetical protein